MTFIERLQKAHSERIPPSATSSAPTMKADSSEDKYIAAAAISSGLPSLLTGVKSPILSHIAFASSVLAATVLKIGVSTGPGVNTFTRILRSNSSAEKLLASERTTAFEAAVSAESNHLSLALKPYSINVIHMPAGKK